jgi:acyl-CoA thioesterase-1
MGTRFWRFSHLIMHGILGRSTSRFIRLSVLAGLLLLAVALHATPVEQKILVLGDSISAAYGMSLEQGWVAALAEKLQQENPELSVVNASISGETTAGGLRRLPDLLQSHRPDLVIIELGGNDGLRGYPLESLEKNLADMVAFSQQAGASVILVPMEIPPNYGHRYSSGFREAYQNVARASGSELAPFILEGIATRPGMMQADGIHPTAEAQPLLLDNMLPTVARVLDGL